MKKRGGSWYLSELSIVVGIIVLLMITLIGWGVYKQDADEGLFSEHMVCYNDCDEPFDQEE